MIRVLICIGLIPLMHLSLSGQVIVNASFEGDPAPSSLPYGWEPCGAGSTPDTQPGSWGVLTDAASGHTYLSLICRGEGVPFPGQWETCQQHLAQPLRAGVCYVYTVDLAHTETFAAAGITFGGYARLRVWGAAGPCQPQQLLWESPAVTHDTWYTYPFVFKPEADYPYILLEAYYTVMPKYSGNILVDNLQYVPEQNPCLPTM
ncbi:MAG: hypothetical protein SF053_15820 [Bacteroidia bacterium]|nr:hypothetical protein [Bacteroidia bacterium]